MPATDPRDERDPGAAPATDSPSRFGVDRGDRVHEFQGDGITVTWSRRRCTHVAECVLNLPAVFAPGRRPWVDPSRASATAIARAVARCPTGALHSARPDGTAIEAVPEVNSVVVARNGPIYVRGDIAVQDDAGGTRLVDTRVALCRCGLSAHKPICDGAHTAAGFRDAGEVTGALEEAPLPDGKLRVRTRTDGPLVLEGPMALTGGRAETILSGTRAVLCRCGGSQAKPFCDGSHKTNGFRSGEPPRNP